MTLITALKYKGGVLIATDSRVLFGYGLKKDQERKVEIISDKVAVGAAGLTGAIDDILKVLKTYPYSTTDPFDEVANILSNTSLNWLNANKEKLGENGSGPDFIVVSSDRIRKVFDGGFQEESSDYAIEGSGRNFGEYIFAKEYYDNIELKQAQRLAAFCIKETSEMDTSVGGDVSMVILDQKEGIRQVPKHEIVALVAQLSSKRLFSEDDLNRLVEEIIVKREQVNLSFEKKFDFYPLKQRERSMFNFVRPCVTEEDFAYHIGSLGIVMDAADNEKLREILSIKDSSLKSIGLLTQFVKKYIGDNEAEQFKNYLNKIRCLRNQNFPIHDSQPEFITTVAELIGSYPPRWRELWVKSLELYKESLDILLECGDNVPDTSEEN